MDRDKARTTRLQKLFHAIISNTIPVSPHNGHLFLESIYTHPHPVECLGKITTSSIGITCLKTAIRYDLSVKFMNTHASSLIQYMRSPELKAINSGDFLNDILLNLVDPPIFWTEFKKLFLQGVLDEAASQNFGWLLLELCSSLSPQLNTYRVAEDMPIILNSMDSSPLESVKVLGGRIRGLLITAQPCNDIVNADFGPGGRHDNDFADFHKISIRPTNDELKSTELPFLRPSSTLEDPKMEGSRVSVHLDNQFRLLREDMIHEMREELQLATGLKKGKYRGNKIKKLTLHDIELGSDDKDKKRMKWALVFQCGDDFFPSEFKSQKDPKKRKEYLTNKRQFLKHQSMACLLDGNEVIAFPTIYRDEERLVKDPPEIVLQFEDAESTRLALRKLKMENEFMLVQVETAIFAYEPILKGLQQALTVPLSSEILEWKVGSQPAEIEGSQQCAEILHPLRNNPQVNLKHILNTTKDIKLDNSQTSSLISGLTQQLSLIQGPPGTGKSFIGGLIAKSIHDFSERTILVVCYTNHALDDILTGLLDIGIPENSMLRLGGKSTARTEPLTLQKQARTGGKRTPTEWKIIDELKVSLSNLRRGVETSFHRYSSSKVHLSIILDYLEIEAPEYYEAFRMPDLEDGMAIVGSEGKAAQSDYLLERWTKGQDAGTLMGRISSHGPWTLSKKQRDGLMNQWKDALLMEAIEEFCDNAQEFNRCDERLNRAFSSDRAEILKGKRIVGCTTTAAAMYREEIQTFNPDILLVEEAGEILESHVLTAIGPHTSQIVLIGDHKQLRPKVNNYLLTVEKGDGYDLNRSLFERLILKDYPHEYLSEQHRMRPEISGLIRSLTYPELKDAPGTQNRPNILGVQDNIVFIHHEHPEDSHTGLTDRSDMTSKSSKQNSFEIDMVLKIVRYLGQQGYGTDKVVILTPYLGQLHKLREDLKKIADPILNDLDSYELVRAGLITPAAAKLAKKPIRLATIDNYQGEESDIVIASLTRSNPQNDIGFMFAPERLNVLLSRARNGLIMIGNAITFQNARKGKELWRQLFGLLNDGKHVYQGLPIKCEKHPDYTSIITSASQFDEVCPDGGCTLPCGARLSCGLHDCPSRCHQLSNHSKLVCKEKISSQCPDGHSETWLCGEVRPRTCKKCDRAKKLAKQRQDEESAAQIRRDAEQKAHLEKMDILNAQIAQAARTREDERLAMERANAIKQRERDLASILSTKGSPVTRAPVASSAPTPGSSIPTPPQTIHTSVSSSTTYSEPSNSPVGPQVTNNASITSIFSGMARNLFKPFQTEKQTDDNINQANLDGKPIKGLSVSPSVMEWNRQKNLEGVQNDAVESIMKMIGLEDIKKNVLNIKDKIDISLRQNSSLKRERFNAAFLGNPGTGKTTVARHYAKFLASMKITPGETFLETTGAKLAHESVDGAKKLVDSAIKAGGGTIFIDEAYQLTNANNPGGPAVLDFLLAEMENNVGTLVFILAGYNKEMEKFFEHNPGLKSRVPHQFQFKDYENEELMAIFEDTVKGTYQERMKVEGGIKGLYCRIVIRRLGRQRGRPGFGNTRELQNVFSRIKERQATRIREERKEGRTPDDFLLVREDLIGPHPTTALSKSKAWNTLDKMIGLKTVKESLKSLLSLIEENYDRELLEKEPMDVSLNRVFLGSPGTGKTTVATLYGQILAELGLLSNGEVVVKNSSDFVGAVLGASETNTKAILSNSVGKVLIIDEAYMLYGGGTNDGQNNGGSSSNQFKTSVIDTIVAEVQNVPGEDRCVLLLGYKDQMIEMFQNVNPGLSRRFKVEEAFDFEDFTEPELLRILELKLQNQDLEATDQAKKVAIEKLSRIKRRPNFGNAGEVENLITQAKTRAVERRSRIPRAERNHNVVFLPDDIDPDWDRSAKASADLIRLFNDVVGCRDIVQRLENYQQIVQTCKEQEIDPLNLIPTNFVFSGPPGTGKTTIARKFGQVFYNMGMLASAEVVECSASDLVGQFVGQTGPKTKKLFEKALGKVLFVDEAYRLSQGHFAQEAIDEVVGLLTHPTFKSKLIVILAGYEKDMNKLMTVNSGLSSRFPEQIYFSNMDTESCLKVIDVELQKMKMVIDMDDTVKKEMEEVIRDLSELPDWGNARDMVTVSKSFIQRALLQKLTVLPGSHALDELKKLLADKQRRSKVPPKNTRSPDDLPIQSFIRDPGPPPTLGTNTTISTGAPAKRPDNARPRNRRGTNGQRPNQDYRNADGLSQENGNNSRRNQDRRTTDGQPQQRENIQRDPGVSDTIWKQMKAAMRAAAEIERDAKKHIDNLRRQMETERKQAEDAKKRAADLRRAEAVERDAARRADLLRQREEAKLKELAARAAKEKAAAELRAKKQAEERRKAKEERAQQKLRELGVCPVGYRWIKMGSMYRCAGGSHCVSADSLGL